MLKKWYQQDGAHAGIVISTRIRLARNLAGIPFPGNMTGEQEKEVIEKCLAALRADESALPEKLKFIDFKGLSPVQIRSLTERHLISPDFEKPGGEKALLLSDDESVSIMINEEDHLRIQCIAAGRELKETLRRANQVDALAAAGLDLAFDEHLGYLTHCPTNLGTGLRASVMLHLPILTGNGQIGQVV
jgi:protein arginine kinase